MICKDYKCVFIHVPKVAGQSIELFFAQLIGLTWQSRAPLLLRFNPDPAFGPRRLAHLMASEYVPCGHITEAEFNSFYKFSFVRNPWDRIVSEYKYRGHSKRFDFKSFLFKHLPSSKLSDGRRHIISQHCFLYDESGRQLVDFIGRFENLQKDFDFVCKRLNISNAILPHRNQSPNRKNYIEYYDSESKEFIAKLYEKDIKMFNYSFGA
jgi:hypothetical protein